MVADYDPWYSASRQRFNAEDFHYLFYKCNERSPKLSMSVLANGASNKRLGCVVDWGNQDEDVEVWDDWCVETFLFSICAW